MPSKYLKSILRGRGYLVIKTLSETDLSKARILESMHKNLSLEQLTNLNKSYNNAKSG